MPFVSRGLALAALLVAAPHPTFAASAATQALLDNLIPNVDFLDRSSRLALDHAHAPRLKAFARAEAREQTAAIDALYDWTRGPAPAHPALVALAGAPTSAVKALDATPTGSVATPWPPHAVAPDPTDTRLPRGQEDLDSLDGLDGAAFDADLKTKQADALAQIETDYATYLAKGDDPALLALATAELPRVRAAIAALKRL